MSLDVGFNFRQTLAFVTDPANTQFVDPTVTYPQTAGGVTFGWLDLSALQTRDRSAGVDARLAGLDRIDANSPTQFRVDLPATGDYQLQWAMGDASYAAGPMYYRLLDNASVLLTVTAQSTSGGGKFIDATGVERTSAADWVTNSAPATYTFASTILLFEIGSTVGGSSSPIAHLRIVQVASDATTTIVGQWDETQVAKGWFEPVLKPVGWFDVELITNDVDIDLASTGSITFSGTSSLTSVGSLESIGEIAFGSVGGTLGDGVGVLASTAAVAFGGTAVLTGLGTLASTASITFADAISLTGLGTLLSTGAITFGDTASLSSVGSLASTAAIAFSGTESLTAVGTVASTAAITFGATATLTGKGTLSSAGAVTFGSVSALSGVGTLASTGEIAFSSVSNLTSPSGRHRTRVIT